MSVSMCCIVVLAVLHTSNTRIRCINVFPNRHCSLKTLKVNSLRPHSDQVLTSFQADQFTSVTHLVIWFFRPLVEVVWDACGCGTIWPYCYCDCKCQCVPDASLTTSDDYIFIYKIFYLEFLFPCFICVTCWKHM